MAMHAGSHGPSQPVAVAREVAVHGARHRWAGLGGACVLALVGCPGPAAPAASADAAATDQATASETSVGPAIAIDELRAAFIAARCSAYDTCVPSTSWFASLSGCAASFSPRQPLGDWPKWLKAGQVSYDAAKAAACVQAAKDCGNIGLYPKVCEEVFQPAVPNGGVCRIDATCVGGKCAKLSPESLASCGTCATAEVAKLGQPCLSWPCEAGTSCAGWPKPTCVKNGSGGAGDKCVGASCAAPLRCGQDPASADSVCLALGKIGEPCITVQSCTPGLVCAPKSASSAERFCREPRSLGDPCFQYDFPSPGKMQTTGGDCGGGNTCGVIGDWDGTGVPETRCVARRKMGESCTSHWQCGLLDAICVAGICSPRPGPGQPCVKVGSVDACAAESSCYQGTCVAHPGLGQPCAGPCTVGLACRADPATGAQTCALSGQAGAACKSDYDCGAEAKCGSGICYAVACP